MCLAPMTVEEDLQLQLSLSFEYHSSFVAVYAVCPDQVLHTEQHTSEAASDDEEY